MIRFTPIKDAEAAAGYYGRTDGGYYMDDAGLRREMGGKLAQQLGLDGEPTLDQLTRMLNGLHPLTGKKLTARLVKNRICGTDLTASLPKEVTEAIEGGDSRVEKAVWDSLRRTLEEVEERVTTRVRKGFMQDDRVTSNMAWFAFEHPETRPTELDNMPRPDRHIHVVIPSMTLDEAEGQVKAIKWRPHFDLRKWFSHRFDLRLSTALADLGYDIETVTRDDSKGGQRYHSWRLKGMPESMIAFDSQRHEEIEALAEELGITSPLGMAKMGATSRREKRDDLTLADCRDFWDRSRTPEELAGRAECIRRAAQGENPRARSAVAEAAAFAIEHEFHRKSVVRLTDLEITAMERCMGRGRPEELRAEFVRQGVLIDGDEATTATLRQQEMEIRDICRGGLGKCRPVVADRNIDVPALIKAAGGTILKPADAAEREAARQQYAALAALLRSRNRYGILDAGQGTGKTTLLESFGKILAAHLVPTTWLGTTHRAVEELQARGLPAMTVAHFLKSQEAQADAVGTRLIVDESSMLSHQDHWRLTRFANDHACRIDYVGDHSQYKTPAAGDPMRLLVRHGGLTPITMSQTIRQKGRLMEAMNAVRENRVLDGHDILSELGMVRELPLDRLAQSAADLYLEWSVKGQDVPVISPTHAQADDIAARIRAGLRDCGDLKGKDKTVRRLVSLDWSPAQVKEARRQGIPTGIVLRYANAYRDDTQALAVGDRVRTTMGGKSKDGLHTLKNGQKYRITGFTKAGDPILDNGAVVDKQWGGLVQNYVGTGQAAQGLTAKRAIVVYGTPSLVAVRQEGFYVPVSRVKTEVAVLTDSNEALREAIQKQDTRKFALDLFEEQQRPKPLALLDLPLKERLGRHLAQVRRLAAFTRRPDRRQKPLPTPPHTPAPEREHGHAR